QPRASGSAGTRSRKCSPLLPSTSRFRARTPRARWPLRPWRRWTRQRSDPLPRSAHPARGPVRIVTLGHLNCRRAEIGNRLVRSCSDRLRRSPMSEAPVSRGVYKFAVFALAIGAFGIGVTEFATMGLLPMIAEELGITVPQAGHSVSFYAIG